MRYNYNLEAVLIFFMFIFGVILEVFFRGVGIIVLLTIIALELNKIYDAVRKR